MLGAALSQALSQWQPQELLTLLGILVGAALALAWVLAWRRIRLAQEDAALKREMLQRNLTVEEMERLLRARVAPDEPPPLPGDLIEELTTYLGQHEVTGETLTEIMGLVREAPLPRLQAVTRTVAGLSAGAEEAGRELTGAEILAAIQGLCGPAAGSPRESAGAAVSSGFTVPRSA